VVPCLLDGIRFLLIPSPSDLHDRLSEPRKAMVSGFPSDWCSIEIRSFHNRAGKYRVNVYLSVERRRIDVSGTAERLLDLAEGRIREGGYHGFSFRELAVEIGITSASVHHHFPTKAVMVAAVAKRYNDRFFSELVSAQPGETGVSVIARYRSIFRKRLERDGGMCLIGILGAEAGGLPAVIFEQTGQFFRKAVDDLGSRIGGANAQESAFAILATLEGGVILARSYGNIGAFDHATASLAHQLEATS
jgi:TetR/AcrR family transcriptional repressor of nem operon